MHRLHCSISVHLSSTSLKGQLLCLFSGLWSEKDCHEFDFIRDTEVVERSLVHVAGSFGYFFCFKSTVYMCSYIIDYALVKIKYQIIIDRDGGT